MTKKDYELIASILNEFGNNQEINGFGRHLANSLSRTFIAKFKLDNLNFNADKFAKACGCERYF